MLGAVFIAPPTLGYFYTMGTRWPESGRQPAKVAESVVIGELAPKSRGDDPVELAAGTDDTRQRTTPKSIINVGISVF